MSEAQRDLSEAMRSIIREVRLDQCKADRQMVLAFVAGCRTQGVESVRLELVEGLADALMAGIEGNR